jgi:acyl-coenzyme A synthetase/AMP-(fatty) acid ligase
MSGEILHAWRRVLRRRPCDTAVVQASDGRSCTFAELDVLSAGWFAAHAAAVPGSLAGRAVVFSAPNGIGWFEIFLGLARAGAVAVPMDPAEPAAALRSLAAALRAACVWDGARLLPLPGPMRYRDPAIALVKLTSGTTGRPRPLAFTTGQLLADARQVTGTMGIRPADLNYGLVPFGHSYGLGNLALPLLAQGVPVVCGSAPLPHAIAADFARWRPTVFPGVPAVWRALSASGVEPRDLSSLRLAISAGAPLLPADAREFRRRFGLSLHNFYGSSETGGISYDRSGRATREGGVGRALRGVRLLPGAGGRLRVCSAAVFTRGNRARCGAAGCWTPSDRVSLSDRGELAIAGRRGTLVKIAGRRVNLAEVAARLRRIAGVRDAWVGVPSAGEPVIGAALATRRSAADLRTEVMADTAPWKIPKHWLVLPELPLTARGKVDARILAARLFRRP